MTASGQHQVGGEGWLEAAPTLLQLGELDQKLGVEVVLVGGLELDIVLIGTEYAGKFNVMDSSDLERHFPTKLSEIETVE